MKVLRRMLKKDKLGAVSGIVVLIMIGLAVFAPLIAPKDPLQIESRRVLSDGTTTFPPYPPSKINFFGTDQLGRDLFSRVLYGLRVSLLVGFIVRGASMVVGVVVGLLAGYFGGAWDRLLNYICDIMLAFPSLLIAMAITLVLGPSLASVCIALVLIGWPDVAKIVRAQVMSVKRKEYIEAARAIGLSEMSILFRHVLPNCMNVILVSFSMGIPGAIMYESGLSFFGLGIRPPQPSLGSIISDGRGYIALAPWYICLPGLVLAVLVLAFNIFGDALQDALDPRRSR